MDWIPVDKGMPEEHESMFARYWGTDKWTTAMCLKESNKVLATVEFEDGSKLVKTVRTADGIWKTGLYFTKTKVIAWMPIPEPYGEE